MTTTKYVKRGNGTAIHIAKEYIELDGTVFLLAARCDKFGRTAGRVVRYIDASAATCKTCLRAAELQKVSA